MKKIYNADDILVDKILKFPKVRELPNYQREMTWKVVLKEETSHNISKFKDISKQLSHENFKVNIKVKNKKNLRVYIKTDVNPNPYSHDYRVIDIHNMFDRIEELLGKIDTIEGKKFDQIWNPFKK